MDVHEVLYTTRAMRRLKPDPVPLDVQARILDAAIRAPHIDQQWRFLLVDDREIMAKLGDLYRQAWNELFEKMGVSVANLMQMDNDHGKAARSGNYLAKHFNDVPLALIGFSRDREGSGIYPALWNAMLAARAEGIGSTLTGVVHSLKQDEACDLFGVPKDAGWHMHGLVPMGYPKGRWGLATRKPVEDVAYRNRWEGDLGFTVPEPLWQPA